MPRELEESLEDLRRAKSHIEQAAACLFNIVLHGEGGDEIKLLRFDLLSLMGECDDIQEIWEAEGV